MHHHDHGEDECDDYLRHMSKKMQKITVDNMDIINIMKIDRIEQSLDGVKCKLGHGHEHGKSKKRKMSMAASSMNHDPLMSDVNFGIEPK